MQLPLRILVVQQHRDLEEAVMDLIQQQARDLARAQVALAAVQALEQQRLGQLPPQLPPTPPMESQQLPQVKK